MASTIKNPSFTKGYKRYVLLLLTGVYTFNFVDRQLIVILQESIKLELGLSDTQLGLMSGFAFAIFYVTLGIPIASWADRANRKNIVVWSLGIWSAMTVICGMAGNFMQLLLARIGVGIGEAGGSPPSHSIISDYFEPEQRGTALGTYSMGVYIGIIFGYLIGGIIDQLYGWRVAFFSLGIPGILFAFWVWWAVKEPPRGYSDPEDKKTSKKYSFWEVLRYLFKKKTFIYLALACGFHSFVGYGTGNFFAPFLARLHGLGSMEIGIWLAGAMGLAGAVGTFLGGYLADRLQHKDLRWYVWIPILANFISTPFGLYVFFSGNTYLALIIYIIPNICFASYLGPSLAVTHGLVPAQMRALASAVLFFILNLIGLGLGPTVVGMISDALQPEYGVESIRWAMAIASLVGVLAAIFFYLASRHIREDMEIHAVQT